MPRAKRLALAALLPVVVAPVISNADSGAAMDACVQAFLATELPKDQKVVVRKDLDSLRGPVAVSGLYRIEVVAKTSGKQIARTVCHANGSGQIVAINGHTPAVSPSALVSSR